jgi:Sigma-54 interaction domain
MAAGLEIQEFIAEFEKLHPGVDLITVDDSSAGRTTRSPRRNEVLYALRRGQDADGATWNSAPILERDDAHVPGAAKTSKEISSGLQKVASLPQEGERKSIAATHRLPEFIGQHSRMLEVSRRIRMVAPHATPVLVQGATGTGKELVARALHRLSPRSLRPFVALNCAAIPESLLEAELFGHTRGAFTGAVQGRVGRIEAAHGGTLFLDEIGEMPLTLQAKLLRFVESGELQRVGENDVSYVQTPAGQQIQLNVPGDQIFTAAGGNVLGSLNALIADFSSGAPSATSVADLAALSQSLDYVDQQRAVIDNSINRLTASSNYASSESTQLLSAEDNLIQTDTASVATQLNSAETQQAALTQVIASLDQQGTLFQAL